MAYFTSFRIVKEQICFIRNKPQQTPEANLLNETDLILVFNQQKHISKIGGAEEDRTPDLLRARQALSQLSYGPGKIYQNCADQGAAK